MASGERPLAAGKRNSRQRLEARRRVMPLTFGHLLAALLALFSAAAGSAGPRPIFVLNSQDANVSIIDATTYLHLQGLATGKEPHHLYLAPDEKSPIAANA